MNEGERTGSNRNSDPYRKTAWASKTGWRGGAQGPQIRFCGEYTRGIWNPGEEHGDLPEMDAWRFTRIGQERSERTRLPILPVFVMLLVRLGSASVRAGCAHATEHLRDWKRQLTKGKKLGGPPAKIAGTEVEESTARREGETKQYVGGARQVQTCPGLSLIPGQPGYSGGPGEPPLSDREGKGMTELQGDKRLRRTGGRQPLAQSGRDLFQFVRRHA